VSTELGSGVWLESVQFPQDLAGLGEGVRAMMEWTELGPWKCGLRLQAEYGRWSFEEAASGGSAENSRDESSNPGSPRRFRKPVLPQLRPLVRRRIGEPAFPRAPIGWETVERELDAFAESCKRNVAAQDSMGPFCCRRCLNEFLEKDSEGAGILEVRHRIAGEAERLRGLEAVRAAERALAEFREALASFDDAQRSALDEWGRTNEADKIRYLLQDWCESQGRRHPPFLVPEEWFDQWSRE
jgi:hypothetical protein